MVKEMIVMECDGRVRLYVRRRKKGVQTVKSLESNKKKGLFSSAVLKNTAYITMFIDHFFAVVFLTVIRQYQRAGYPTDGMQQIYTAGRAVGRIAFIIFACLMVEGFLHTRSRRNYLLRLGLFALVSEIPFDLAFSETYFDPTGQNVFFTLFLGILALTAWEWAQDQAASVRAETGNYLVCGVLRGVGTLALLSCCVAAWFLQTDYKYMGVLLIFAFYQTRDRELPVRILAAGCVMLLGTWSANWLRHAGEFSAEYLFRFSLREMYGLFAFFWIGLYNGKKGRQLPKAFYYGFYPVHLLALYFVAAMVLDGRLPVF